MIGHSGADWLAVADDAEVTLDIRLLIETAFVNGLRLVSKGAVGDGGNVAHEIFELV